MRAAGTLGAIILVVVGSFVGWSWVRGRIMTRVGWIGRQDDPFSFWFNALTYLGLALTIAILLNMEI
jgi:hypothetical protein